MGRPHAMKGRKNKRKLDEAEEVKEEDMAAEGLPVVPRSVDGKRQPGAIFVLERACLEVGKVGKVRDGLAAARNFSVSCDFILVPVDFSEVMFV
jgi:hypothetical protein